MINSLRREKQSKTIQLIFIKLLLSTAGIIKWITQSLLLSSQTLMEEKNTQTTAKYLLGNKNTVMEM